MPLAAFGISINQVSCYPLRPVNDYMENIRSSNLNAEMGQTTWPDKLDETETGINLKRGGCSWSNRLHG